MTEDLRMTLMLYEDGELSEEESRKVEEFLKEHPDVAKDMLWWEKESATLKKMGVGRLSHEEFKKKIADVVNKDATSNDQSEETADVLPLKKKTFLTNVFTLAAANDNSWMKVAASLLIVAFVGYGLLLPGGTNVKYIALLEQSKGTQKESLDYVLAKSGLVSDGDFLRLLKDPSMRLSITDIGPALVQVKIKNREDGLQTDLSDGDIVQVDDQIKIFVNEIKEDGYLSITHKDSDGKDRKLLSSKKVTRGVPTFALPEKGWWLVTAGKDLETLSFTFSR